MQQPAVKTIPATTLNILISNKGSSIDPKSLLSKEVMNVAQHQETLFSVFPIDRLDFLRILALSNPSVPRTEDLMPTEEGLDLLDIFIKEMNARTLSEVKMIPGESCIELVRSTDSTDEFSLTEEFTVAVHELTGMYRALRLGSNMMAVVGAGNLMSVHDAADSIDSLGQSLVELNTEFANYLIELYEEGQAAEVAGIADALGVDFVDADADEVEGVGVDLGAGSGLGLDLDLDLEPIEVNHA